MSRFVYINGEYINVDMIASVKGSFKINEKCKVTFKDGTYTYIDGTYVDLLLGEDHLVQVLTVNEPITAVYDCDGEEYEEDVYYLGLFADGRVRPLILQDGYYDAIDADNYKGLHSKVYSWRRKEPANENLNARQKANN